MSTDMSSLLSALMASGGREAIAGREDGLKKLAGSGAGMKVGRMVGADEELKKALERGDAETVKKRVSALLSTKEGAELAAKLSELMK
jgi:hypothetical protein